jgi:hypothetical protein
MSYIRSTSNPENLYIWSDGTNITIEMGGDTIGQIPTDVFDGLIVKCYKSWEDTIKYKKAKIEQVFIEDNTKPKILDTFTQGDFKIKLSYDNWELLMWEVTWDSVVYTNYKNILSRKRKKKLSEF